MRSGMGSGRCLRGQCWLGASLRLGRRYIILFLRSRWCGLLFLWLVRWNQRHFWLRNHRWVLSHRRHIWRWLGSGSNLSWLCLNRWWCGRRRIDRCLRWCIDRSWRLRRRSIQRRRLLCRLGWRCVYRRCRFSISDGWLRRSGGRRWRIGSRRWW